MRVRTKKISERFDIPEEMIEEPIPDGIEFFIEVRPLTRGERDHRTEKGMVSRTPLPAEVRRGRRRARTEAMEDLEVYQEMRIAAMRMYEWETSITDFCFPADNEKGYVKFGSKEKNRQVLDCVDEDLEIWIDDKIDEVNGFSATEEEEEEQAVNFTEKSSEPFSGPESA